MYIRCAGCRASTWIDELLPEGESQTLACDGCDRSYTVVIPAELGGDSKSAYRSALALAEQRDLDLPTACSVLLGILTPERARQAVEPARAKRKKTRRWSKRIGPDYDPGFADAVAEGFLTAREARDRGDRETFARQMMQRHDLPTTLAYLVADNKIGIDAALRRLSDEQREADRRAGRPMPVTRRQVAWLSGMTAPLLAAILLFAAAHWNRHAAPPLNAAAGPGLAPGSSATPALRPGPAADRSRPDAPDSRNALQVLRDEQGRLTRIAGRTPEAVLHAFCAEYAEAGILEPLEIVQTVPASAATRLGVYRDYRDLAVKHAVRIRRDRDSRAWAAGYGRLPIVPLRDPRLPQ